MYKKQHKFYFYLVRIHWEIYGGNLANVIGGEKHERKEAKRRNPLKEERRTIQEKWTENGKRRELKA
jgi:hypothetical protein